MLSFILPKVLYFYPSFNHPPITSHKLFQSPFSRKFRSQIKPAPAPSSRKRQPPIQMSEIFEFLSFIAIVEAFGSGSKEGGGIFLKKALFSKDRKTRINQLALLRKCPCGSDKAFGECCHPYVSGKAYPNDPITLLRARFSAYAFEECDFIGSTTAENSEDYVHDENSPLYKEWMEKVREFCNEYSFRNVEIYDVMYSSESICHILFRANLTEKGEDIGFVERSTFTLDSSNRWKYFCGDLEQISVIEEPEK